ncbi:hypothetical protein Y026_5468 [Burkholderia pseudomallei TSV28]|nr:hypothetical protein Y026_5468 [Burkholderia pseudomallei TSV28]
MGNQRATVQLTTTTSYLSAFISRQSSIVLLEYRRRISFDNTPEPVSCVQNEYSTRSIIQLFESAASAKIDDEMVADK